MRALLIVAHGTIIDAFGKNIPNIIEHGCGFRLHVIRCRTAFFEAVACLDITLEPLFFGDLLGAPGQFAHQFVHHGIGFRTFHGEADAHKVFCLGMRLGKVEVIEQLVHASVHTHVGTEVLEQTEAPVVLLVAILLVPKARHTPHGTAFAEEVEEDNITWRDGFEHLGTWILRPALADPFGIRIGFLHGSIHGFEAGLEVEVGGQVGCFVEGIHRIVVGLAEETDALSVIEVGELLETWVGGHEDAGTGEAVPKLNVGDSRFAIVLLVGRRCGLFLHELAGHHSAISGEHGMDVELLHAGDDLLL